VRDLAATEGKRFAVTADEAHSSQTGETAAKLKSVLSVDETADLVDGGEVNSEDTRAVNTPWQRSTRLPPQERHLSLPRS
jgi:type I restriction enzyme R subunit